MRIETVHLVYPFGDEVRTPMAIGREIAVRLSAMYDVSLHRWDGHERIVGSANAALVGHAHPYPGTTFRRSMRDRRWGRKLLLQPFATDPGTNGYLVDIIPHVDGFLALTGNYWMMKLPYSRFGFARDLVTQIDLAVDRTTFAPLFSSADRGAKACVYIGNDTKAKNLPYLDAIAGELRKSGVRVGWIGDGRYRPRYLERLGRRDLTDQRDRMLLRQFPFLLMASRADACATVVLEAMALGIIPICTPQTGYVGFPGIRNIPLGNAVRAAQIVRGMLERPAAELESIRQANWRMVEARFNWERLAMQVSAAIADPALHPTRGCRAGLVDGIMGRFWFLRESPFSPVTRSGCINVGRHLVDSVNGRGKYRGDC